MAETTAPSRSSLDEAVDFYERGIDRMLIEATLRLTVDQRLAELQRLFDFAQELRRAGRAIGREA